MYLYFLCLYIYVLWSPQWPSGKEFTCNAGDTGDEGSILGSKRSPGGGHSNPLQYSCWENPMDRGTWQATVHWVTNAGYSPLGYKESDTTEATKRKGFLLCLSIHLQISIWVVSIFRLLWVMLPRTLGYIAVWAFAFSEDVLSNSSGCIPRSGIARSYGNSV